MEDASMIQFDVRDVVSASGSWYRSAGVVTMAGGEEAQWTDVYVGAEASTT